MLCTLHTIQKIDIDQWMHKCRFEVSHLCVDSRLPIHIDFFALEILRGAFHEPSANICVYFDELVNFVRCRNFGY